MEEGVREAIQQGMIQAAWDRTIEKIVQEKLENLLQSASKNKKKGKMREIRMVRREASIKK